MSNNTKRYIKDAHIAQLQIEECALIREPYFRQLTIVRLSNYQTLYAKFCPSYLAKVLVFYDRCCPLKKSHDKKNSSGEIL